MLDLLEGTFNNYISYNPHFFEFQLLAPNLLHYPTKSLENYFFPHSSFIWILYLKLEVNY